MLEDNGTTNERKDGGTNALFFQNGQKIKNDRS
jgi:hypothetical protein